MSDSPRLRREFDRYVDGRLMAEGVSVSQADTLDEAIQKAVRICPRAPNTVLVLRNQEVISND